MESIEDIIKRREKREEQERALQHEQAQREEQEEAKRSQKQISQEISLALGRLAALEYPGAQTMSIREEAPRRFWGTTIKRTDIIVWHLFNDEVGRGSYDTPIIESYYLTSTGGILICGDYVDEKSPTKIYEAYANPIVLPSIMDLGVVDTPDSQ